MNPYSLLMILLSLFVYKYIQQYKCFHIKGPLKKVVYDNNKTGVGYNFIIITSLYIHINRNLTL